MQSGDPTGTGKGGSSVYGQLYGDQVRARYSAPVYPCTLRGNTKLESRLLRPPFSIFSFQPLSSHAFCAATVRPQHSTLAFNGRVFPVQMLAPAG